MRKNVAGQYVDAHLSARTDGSPVTSGTTSVFITGDNGSQAAGAGTVTHKGNGLWCYSPTQGETNYNHVVFSFVNATAVNAGVQLYPRLPDLNQGIVDSGTAQSVTGTSATLRAGFSAGDNTIAGAILFISAAATGAYQARPVKTWNNTTKVATVDAWTITPTGTIDYVLFAAPPAAASPPDVNVVSMAANTLTASALATDAVTEIQAGLATSAGLSTLATAAAQTTMQTDVTTIKTGVQPLTLAAIKNAVLDEALSGHLTAGTVGKAISDGAAAPIDPWATAQPGPYAPGTFGNLVATNLDGTITSRAAQTTADAIKAKTDALPSFPAAVGDAMTLTSGERTAVADTLLKRDMGAVSGEASRSPLNAFRLLRNKRSVASGQLTVTKEDDSTTAWTAAITTAPGDPATNVDPA